MVENQGSIYVTDHSEDETAAVEREEGALGEEDRLGARFLVAGGTDSKKGQSDPDNQDDVKRKDEMPSKGGQSQKPTK